MMMTTTMKAVTTTALGVLVFNAPHNKHPTAVNKLFKLIMSRTPENWNVSLSHILVFIAFLDVNYQTPSRLNDTGRTFQYF